MNTNINFDTTRQIALIWDIEDVQAVAPNLTDEQAFEVLKSAKNRHDANLGVNWDVLETLACDMFPDENE